MKQLPVFLIVLGLGSSALPSLRAAEKIDFALDVKPILESTCLSCHGQEKPKGGLRLTTRAKAIEGGDGGTSLVPGDPAKSPLYTTTILPADHDNIMPPKGDTLTKSQTETLRLWIEQGADWPANITLDKKVRVNFVKDIKPIFEFNCVACHREGYDKGGLRMDTRELTFKGGDSGKGVVPHRPKESLVFTSTTLPADHDDLMPPAKKGGPLSKDNIDLISGWIEQGAIWPDGVTLTQQKAEEAGGDELAVVTEVHRKIMANLKVQQESEMKLYSNAIPGSTIGYFMVPIPSGEFNMGSPDAEKGRDPHESPQHKVKVAPFWMGRCEVTWNEYEMFMYTDQEKVQTTETNNPYLDKVSDAVSRPTKPYVEMSFGMGKQGYPAISMTHHAANKYCQWLSAKTGNYYRLPTEAEWEYACRAGTTTPWYFGDDPAALKQHAWFGKNSDFKYQKIGRKLPNPWGLHDMYGNVAEWCLDQYAPDAYKQFPADATGTWWLPSKTPYPHVVRGGHWDEEDPNKIRSATRIFSDKLWKQQDPQLPKSIWYLTDAQFLGFRVVRPLKVPPPEELLKVWNNGVERE
jgi:formylglycine-generating enzyme required for sulfatase activity/mono/diheme cytochrome c family protein